MRSTTDSTASFTRVGDHASEALVLEGPVRLGLWSTRKDFHPTGDVDYSAWIEDCAAAGTGCTVLASSGDVRGHVHDWNGGTANWTYRDITIGTVNYTISVGRQLRLRLMFDHEDVWVAL